MMLATGNMLVAADRIKATAERGPSTGVTHSGETFRSVADDLRDGIPMVFKDRKGKDRIIGLKACGSKNCSGDPAQCSWGKCPYGA